MRTGLIRAISMAALVLFTGLSALPAVAAGNYVQNFTTLPSNWSNVNDRFALGTGSYAGAYVTQATTNQPPRAIAVYDGTTWGTNFTYSAKLNSDSEGGNAVVGGGNRVGITFNYVDSQNYYELSVSMRKTATSDPDSGKATVARWVGGQQSFVGTEYHPAASAPWPTRDTFFTVQVQRIGIRTILSVDGTVVYDGNDLTSTTPGRIGFFAQFNNGRFDDVSVTDNTPTSYLFRSGFNSSVVATTPVCVNGTPTSSWFMTLSGADASGYAWPPTFWGGANTYVFNTAAPCTSSDPPSAMNSYVQIGIKDAPGPTGATSRVLWNNVMQWHTPGTTGLEPRAGVNHNLASGANPGQSYYIRRYLKYPSDLLWLNAEETIHGRMGENAWFTQHEYKTVCASSTTYPGRFVIDWQKPAGVPMYVLRRDNNNNCSPAQGEVWTDKTCKASGKSGECPKMIAGQWFYDEMYVSYPGTGSGGLVKYAINGAMIFNFAITGSEHLPTKPNRIKLTPGYLNTTNVEVQVDDLEVLDHVPCAEFPCGPPTHVPD
jgi:hypothetical protein